MRTTVTIDDALFEKAKLQAEEMRISLGTLIERALQMIVSKKLERKKLKPFKLITVSGELIDLGIDLNRTSELLLREDESFYRNKK